MKTQERSQWTSFSCFEHTQLFNLQFFVEMIRNFFTLKHVSGCQRSGQARFHYTPLKFLRKL